LKEKWNLVEKMSEELKVKENLIFGDIVRLLGKR